MICSLFFDSDYWQDIERSKRVVEEVRLFIQSVNEEHGLTSLLHESLGKKNNLYLCVIAHAVIKVRERFPHIKNVFQSLCRNRRLSENHAISRNSRQVCLT